ncbi:PLC-like phosphodiesterase, TIM beta/alpha-barrel domain [Pseudocohnilembus persalinus]|uniref:PLC-like phosphodiesterase, TIM beta/alpha-barrel domain n=1 Tax=Pseudocohnilembus persalinus TaxID=266149 RepID=A0A0V0QS53_PSEPJ|nr:PLC-like phosphodiesterase, TIM beta/alpha-barrel domain [Pseudocohnilembus persalinus]|eukprot:KRX04826.1 PLC-like phosphodiesterase, TIM beta/alpha-barrel domain [Pseudocohnilembus persalinus]
MKIMLPIIGELNFFDLSVPGTHDSLTYDLSEIFADRANDIPLNYSFFFHTYLSQYFGGYAKKQAVTQTLNIKQQLDNGVRWLDLRAVLSRDSPYSFTQSWYGLHFMQTNDKLLDLAWEIRDWMNNHDQEIVILQLTYHGEQCYSENDYPGITTAQKREFWNDFIEIFQDIAYNSENYSPLNEMSINNLIDADIRTVIYVSDYEQFTDNSPYAINGCQVEQFGNSDIYNQQESYEYEINFFENYHTIKSQKKQNNIYTVKSMATSGMAETMIYSFLDNFLPESFSNLILWQKYNCVLNFQIPANQFCPEILLDLGQWTNYYKQLTLDIALQNNYSLPNAVFVDQIDHEGTMRTGINTGAINYNQQQNEQNARYSFSAAIIKANWNQYCLSNALTAQQQFNCQIIQNYFQISFDKYPVYTFNNVQYGRLIDWPQQLN